MVCPINNRNNLKLNMYTKNERLKRKLTQINTIEYGVKLCQVIMDVINCTDV